MAVIHHKPRPLTRLLQVTLPRESYVLLGQLIQRRVEQDYAPSKATKSAVMDEAITRMAIQEGLIDAPVPQAPKEPKGKPFELVEATPTQIAANDK